MSRGSDKSRNGGKPAGQNKGPKKGGTPKSNTRGGKNQIIGTSRSGKPVTKKEYIARKKRESAPFKNDSNEIRLNKYIANSGLCSRREADIYIKAGSVTVNGKPVTEMGYKVKPGDEVKFDNRSIQPTKKEYFLLNKPKGFITPKKGEPSSKTVFDIMESATSNPLYFVGSLNRPSLGLMLFTTDLEIANKLNNPNQDMRKIYHVTLDRSFKHEDLVAIRKGVVIDREEIKVAEVNFVEGGRNNEIGIKIHSGKDNIVLRIFDHLGYEVKILDRVVLANLTKKDLPRGRYRRLTEQEIINLRMIP
ncbi:pseudouridine synthase [Nonlabens spongiae]|uniref:Pseudouridine synthase n=1 Tax=Nonlabens spongiae TaxID=331648 RepID=A0A1W6MMA8_9FLAO|nr:pseudouridine synthase [Nonlabens spongiae]ARN78702.1 pseudouridine synthase [Nonlabens spongiae]